jgi:uncharacterized protein (TIGR00255 family)
MRSMTGFGTATREGPAGSVACEIRSVNHRQLKISLRVPSSLSHVEADLEAKVRSTLARGAVSGVLRTERALPAAGALVDLPLARRYAEDLADLGTQLGLPGQPDLAMVSALPGVILVKPAGEEGDAALAATATEALDAALADFSASRAKEGKALAKDFEGRLRRIGKALAVVRKRAPLVARAARERLRKRLAELLEGHSEQSVRDAAAREVVLMAERADVAEEVTRLQAHMEAFRAASAADGEAGRRLDFLLQEMLREVNTIGSKSQDAAVAAAVVDMKVEVDRMKEQAANVE